MTGGEVVRVSMPHPETGQEYFMTIRETDGAAYRAARDRAIEAIEAAIKMKLEAGEVRYR